MSNKLVIHNTNNEPMTTKIASSESFKLKVYYDEIDNASTDQNGVQLKRLKTQSETFRIIGISKAKIISNKDSTKTLFTD